MEDDLRPKEHIYGSPWDTSCNLANNAAVSFVTNDPPDSGHCTGTISHGSGGRFKHQHDRFQHVTACSGIWMSHNGIQESMAWNMRKRYHVVKSVGLVYFYMLNGDEWLFGCYSLCNTLREGIPLFNYRDIAYWNPALINLFSRIIAKDVILQTIMILYLRI